MSFFTHAPFFTLFGIIALGTLIGAVRFRGIALGPAGVFFVSLAAGHLLAPSGWTVPHELTELGLILFVYSVGLGAGPRFFATFRRSGLGFLTAGVIATCVGAACAAAIARLFELSGELAAGIYCGATTCTPALAATLDTISRTFGPNNGGTAHVGSALVAYAATYPFSVAAVVLFVQLLPRIRRQPAAVAANSFLRELAAEGEPIEVCAFHVTNPNCAGRTIAEFHALHLANAVISRIRHNGELQVARPTTELSLGDVVMTVGSPEELAKIEAILGEVAPDAMQDPSGNLAADQLLVSRSDVHGKRLADLAITQRFGVIITRVRRDGIFLPPNEELRLEPGDIVNVVGPREELRHVADLIGRQERKLNETSWVPFAAGICAGALVGLIPITLPGGLTVRLGAGGGAFLIALLLGQLGTMGPVRLYVPNAAKHFARELGLVVFLAGAGAAAGAKLVPVLAENGPTIVIAGVVVTLATLLSGAVTIFALCRWNLLFGAGAISAIMTNPPGLAAASNLAESDAPSIGFASVYPIALIVKILLGPLIFLLVRMISQ